MKTVSENTKRSLIYWNQTANGYGIGQSLVSFNLEKCLIENYANVFKEVANSLSSSKKYSFVKVWQDAISKEKKVLDKKLKKDFLNITREDIDRVVRKFRGNLGEILVEKLAEAGYFRKYFINYTPIDDPHNEDYTDATAEDSGSGGPVGIQIKNYAFEVIPREIFVKAAAMDSKWIREGKVSNLSYVSQHIISFTNATEDYKIKDLFKCCIFIGPNEIDKLGLTGVHADKNGSNVKLFEDLYKEIESFK